MDDVGGVVANVSRSHLLWGLLHIRSDHTAGGEKGCTIIIPIFPVCATLPGFAISLLLHFVIFLCWFVVML